MKYGQTLQQRSIPEWAPYNIDYDDLKRLIKKHTTKGQGQAIAIPAQDNGPSQALRDFEDAFLAELRDQHERIQLFILSKAGEIQRRLLALERQAEKLKKRYVVPGRKQISLRGIERFSQAEEDTLRVGEEIQSLARFVGAQRTAFRKLLKKFEKWTGSPSLRTRYKKEISDPPTSLSHWDFQPLLFRWNQALSIIRLPFIDGTYLGSCKDQRRGSGSTKAVSRKGSQSQNVRKGSTSSVRDSRSLPPTVASTVSQIHIAAESGSDVDFDASLATLPLGQKAHRAIYWVHPDNIVGLHVLLLRYTRLRVRPGYSTRSSSFSDHLSDHATHATGPGLAAGGEGGADEASVTVFDNLDRLVKALSGATLSNIQDAAGTFPEKAVANVRWSGGSEALVSWRKDFDHRAPPNVPVCSARTKKKRLPDLFDSLKLGITEDAQKEPAALNTKDDQPEPYQKIREYFASHQDFQPLVQLQSNRSRFVGLTNTSSRGFWAILDQNVTLEKAQVKALGRSRIEAGNNGSRMDFPYAVLEVRSEGQAGSELLKTLDSSHLITRIRGFSLLSQAISVLYKPPTFSSPLWLPVLETDIRQLPGPSRSSRGTVLDSDLTPDSVTASASTGTTSATEGLMSSSTGQAFESSATSVPDMLESPPLSAFKKKRKKSHLGPLRDSPLQSSQESQSRYWNEYDDGDETEEAVYNILVSPVTPWRLPGQDRFSIWMQTVSSKLPSAPKAISQLYSKPAASEERRRLLLDRADGQLPTYDVDPEDSASSSDRSLFPRRAYGTFGSSGPKSGENYRETVLFRVYIGCFVAAIVLLLVTAMLALTGRHRLRLEVSVGVICGVVGSLCFTVIGIGTMLNRRERVGWAHGLLVLMLFSANCVISGVLLARVSVTGVP